MKYTPEITKQLLLDWEAGMTVVELAEKLDVPKRSIITKLGNLGVYKSKKYTNKLGAIPIKKAEYITRIAKLLEVDVERLDSLEKSNKWILALLVDRLPVVVDETTTEKPNLQEQPLTPQPSQSLRLRVTTDE